MGSKPHSKGDNLLRSIYLREEIRRAIVRTAAGIKRDINAKKRVKFID